MPDGKIYSFPYWGGAPWFGIYRMGVVNTDWLKAVDMEIPTSLEELKEVLIAFRDEDPNGNGKKDEIPLSWNGALQHQQPVAFRVEFPGRRLPCAQQPGSSGCSGWKGGICPHPGGI